MTSFFNAAVALALLRLTSAAFLRAGDSDTLECSETQCETCLSCVGQDCKKLLDTTDDYAAKCTACKAHLENFCWTDFKDPNNPGDCYSQWDDATCKKWKVASIPCAADNIDGAHDSDNSDDGSGSNGTTHNNYGSGGYPAFLQIASNPYPDGAVCNSNSGSCPTQQQQQAAKTYFENDCAEGNGGMKKTCLEATCNAYCDKKCIDPGQGGLDGISIGCMLKMQACYDTHAKCLMQSVCKNTKVCDDWKANNCNSDGSWPKTTDGSALIQIRRAREFQALMKEAVDTHKAQKGSLAATAMERRSRETVQDAAWVKKASAVSLDASALSKCEG